jgi:hypothetical protein
MLSQKWRGRGAYHEITGNGEALHRFRETVQRTWLGSGFPLCKWQSPKVTARNHERMYTISGCHLAVVQPRSGLPAWRCGGIMKKKRVPCSKEMSGNLRTMYATVRNGFINE